MKIVEIEFDFTELLDMFNEIVDSMRNNEKNQKRFSCDELKGLSVLGLGHCFILQFYRTKHFLNLTDKQIEDFEVTLQKYLEHITTFSNSKDITH